MIEAALGRSRDRKQAQVFNSAFSVREALCFQSIKSFHPDKSPHLLMEADGQSAKYSKALTLKKLGRDGDLSLGESTCAGHHPPHL